MTRAERPHLLMLRRGSMLIPVAPLDSDRLMELPAGKPLKIVATQPRSVPQNRLYWSALQLISDNLEGSPPVEILHDVVKVKLGYTVTVPTKSGPVIIPGSIAFDKMSQADFRAFFERFKDLVATEIIPGINRAAFEREAHEMLGDPSSTTREPAGVNSAPGGV